MTIIARLAGIEQTIAAALAATTAPGITAVELAERAGIAPDDWQRDVLTSAAPRLILNASRQSGKSTIVALLALHTAISQPGSLVLLVSPSLRQSSELFRRVLDAYRVVAPDSPADAETLLRLELVNGSRVLSLPGKESTLRGFSSVALLVVDEASRVSDDTFNALKPMLAVSGGRLAVLSTPFGRRGFFHREWTEGDGWERYEVPATACPRIPASFLEQERASLLAWNYAQEYCCSFEAAEGAVFGLDDIQAALSPEVTPLWGIAS
jgi:hypothetical protein